MEIPRLIRQLGSDNFQEREAASRNLAAIGEPAEHALRKAMQDPDREVRRRARELVEGLVAQHRNREMTALQGLWVLKTTEYLGEKADQDPLDDELRKLIERQRNPAEERELVEDISQYRAMLAIKGGTFELGQRMVRSRGCRIGPSSIKGMYYLHVDRDPKVMERRWEEPGIRDESHVRYCIYSVRGDTLLMCLRFTNDPRNLPTQFATDEDRDVVLLSFKREKK